MNEQTLSEIEARYPDPDPIDNDVRALVAEVRKLRADLDYHENTCNPEVDNLRKLLAVANLQVDAIRMRCGRICDESSIALDKAAPGNDQNYWGARLRCAQEIGQAIDAGDFTEKQKDEDVKITVNGIPMELAAGGADLSYEDVLRLAEVTSGATVTYHRAAGPKKDGSLLPGQRIMIENGTVIDAIHTGNA